jgi:hypothetical protein
MNERLYEALEVCLQAIETGADIESVLKRYPQMADELRPILEASARAQTLAISSVPENAMRRGRARVLQHAAEMRETVQKPRSTRFALSRLATSLALALIFILSATGLVRASNGALPGDSLYPVKRTWEGMRLFFAFSPEGREDLESEFEQIRLDEVENLLAEGRREAVAFVGSVEEQDENNWVVSGIPIRITPESRLPVAPVTIGASIMVEGYTNLQGFVEAEHVELLGAGISLSPLEPVEIEEPDFENNENEDEIEDEIESLKETGKNSNDDNSNDDDNNENNDVDDSDDNDNDAANDNDNNNDDNDNDDNNHDNDNDNDNDDDEPDEPDDPDDD